MSLTNLLRWIWIVGLAAVPSSALASAGRTELNQSCAVQTGCVPGDDPGFPITLSEPGSYLLTSRLSVPDADTSGITAVGSNVTIDLGGFEIVRVGCTLGFAGCPRFSGAGAGIAYTGSGVLRVSNGAVGGMGSVGVSAPVATAAILSKLALYANGGSGLSTSTATIASDVEAFDNGASGVDAGVAAVVARATAFGNLGGGIDLAGSVLTDARASGEVFSVRSVASVVDGVAVLESVFAATGGLEAIGSVVTGVRAEQVVGPAITGSDGTLVLDSVAGSTSESGLELDAGSAFGRNLLASSSMPAVTGGIDLGGNVCDGAPLCP